VRGRADEPACAVLTTERLLGERDPEVGRDDASVARAQDVVRLQFATHDAGFMRGAEPARDLERDRDGSFEREAPVVREMLSERLALDELHRQGRGPRVRPMSNVRRRSRA